MAAGATHLAVSLIVALLSAALVFGVWYPYPYSEMAGGRELFLILVVVDVVCGPLLTLIIYNPLKSQRELWLDIGLVVVLQLAALVYGLLSVAEARPVWLALEGDRFRVVRVVDIPVESLAKAPEELQQLSLTGPKLVGVRLAQPSDGDYLASVQLAVQGLHPAFRPSRWLDYGQQRQQVVDRAQPLSELRRRHPAHEVLIDEAVREARVPEHKLGFLPLVSEAAQVWVVVVELVGGQPKAFLPLDGW